MASEFDRSTWTRGQAEAAQIDVGLRQYMLQVYNYMASGLALTGIMARLVANNPAVASVFYQMAPNGAMAPTGLGWIAIFAPLGLVFAIQYGVAGRMKFSTAQALFWVYAALMGVSLASVLMIYTGVSVARTFFACASGFGALSLYGYTTKRDLSAMGRFMIMGLFGIIIASVIRMFWSSPGLSFGISVVGVLVFAGLTAYDTQKIKEMYWQADGSDVANRKALMGALRLYLDFINLFLMMLRFMGDRRN